MKKIMVALIVIYFFAGVPDVVAFESFENRDFGEEVEIYKCFEKISCHDGEVFEVAEDLQLDVTEAFGDDLLLQYQILELFRHKKSPHFCSESESVFSDIEMKLDKIIEEISLSRLMWIAGVKTRIRFLRKDEGCSS